MKQRLISSIFIVLYMVAAVAGRLISPYIFDVLVLLAGTAAIVEMTKAYAHSRRYVNEYIATSYIFMLYIGVMYAVFCKGSIGQVLLYFLILGAAYYLLQLLIALIFKENTKNEMLKANCNMGYVKYSFRKAGYGMLIYLYPSVLMGLLFVINHFNNFFVSTLTSTEGIQSVAIIVDFIVISLFVATTFTDTFALLVGSRVKGPKLCPRISPNKTISGAIGGFLFGLIGVLGTYMLYTTNSDFNTLIDGLKIGWAPIIVYAVLAPIVAILGDMLASVVKRKMDIKDYGSVFPGHGGVMDRVDSLCMVGALAFMIGWIIIF